MRQAPCRSERVCSAKARKRFPIGSVTSASDGISSEAAISSRSPALSISRMPAPPTISPRTSSGRRAASTTLMREPSE